MVWAVSDISATLTFFVYARYSCTVLEHIFSSTNTNIQVQCQGFRFIILKSDHTINRIYLNIFNSNHGLTFPWTTSYVQAFAVVSPPELIPCSTVYIL